LWQESKLEKIVKEKEEEVVKGLQDCTFKPKLNQNRNIKGGSGKYHHLNITPSRSMANLQANSINNKSMFNNRQE
jgi:hypothetical protein